MTHRPAGRQSLQRLSKARMHVLRRATTSVAKRDRSAKPGVERNSEGLSGRRERRRPLAANGNVAEAFNTKGDLLQNPEVDSLTAEISACSLLLRIDWGRLLSCRLRSAAVTFARRPFGCRQAANRALFTFISWLHKTAASGNRIPSYEHINDAMYRAATVSLREEKRLQRDDPDQARAKNTMRSSHRGSILPMVHPTFPVTPVS